MRAWTDRARAIIYNYALYKGADEVGAEARG